MIKKKSVKYYILLVLLLILYFINGVYSITHWSITYDESSHYNYGIRVAKGKTEKINKAADNSKLPISVLNTIPRIVEQIINSNTKKNDNGNEDIIHGRFITLFFSLFTILLVFIWSNKLFGIEVGIFAVFLMSLCPNNIAAAVLVTTDAYSSFFFLFTIFIFWEYLNKKTLNHFIQFSIVIAFAQLAKQSLTHMYIVCGLIWILHKIYNKEQIQFRLFFKKFIILIVISLIIINIGFVFKNSFLTIENYTFESDFFIFLQKLVPSWFIIPVPKPYLIGLDMAKYYDQIGGGLTGIIESSYGKVTILGKSSIGGSFWYYYFVSIFFKTPIAIFIFFIWSTYLILSKKILSFNTLLCLSIPILYFVFYMSFLYKTQCGIRQIIFIYPLIFIWCSSIIPFIKTKIQKILLATLSLYLLISVITYFKNYYSYTNEFIPNKTFAYKKVGRSNLLFGQCNNEYVNFLKNQSVYKEAPLQFEKGKFIISLNDYMDNWNTQQYNWLKNYEPIGNICNGCYLLFDIN